MQLGEGFPRLLLVGGEVDTGGIGTGSHDDTSGTYKLKVLDPFYKKNHIYIH